MYFLLVITTGTLMLCIIGYIPIQRIRYISWQTLFWLDSIDWKLVSFRIKEISSHHSHKQDNEKKFITNKQEMIVEKQCRYNTLAPVRNSQSCAYENFTFAWMNIVYFNLFMRTVSRIGHQVMANRHQTVNWPNGHTCDYSSSYREITFYQYLSQL